MWKQYVKFSCKLGSKIEELFPNSMINVSDTLWDCYWIVKGKPDNMVSRCYYE
jgi:hypothetical protein